MLSIRPLSKKELKAHFSNNGSLTLFQTTELQNFTSLFIIKLQTTLSNINILFNLKQKVKNKQNAIETTKPKKKTQTATTVEKLKAGSK